jgi:hypothetical protein
VATAMSKLRRHLQQAEQALGRLGHRRPGRERFPAAVGASDRELIRLGRRDDPLEILRQALAVTGARSGLIHPRW